MKIIKNSIDARCLECLLIDSVALVDGGMVCRNCGETVFIDSGGDIFQPLFIDDPAATFQASQYTPPIKERRIMNRTWPKYKEQRNQGGGL